jgi:hypothetical protein
LERLYFCFQFSFVLFAEINGWTPINFFWRRHTLFFIAKNTLVFTLIVQRVFFFSRTAFSFRFLPWFFVQILFYICIKLYFDHWSMLVFIKRVVSKRVEWCWKREKVSCNKSGTKRSLFRLRLRLFHAMLDVVLIVCLVVFIVAWLVSNDWDCLMSLWKNHAFLYYMEAFIWFSPWCFIWVDLAHPYNMFDSYKVAISLYDHLVFDLWCHFMLLFMMFCRYAWLWPLLLS